MRKTKPAQNAGPWRNRIVGYGEVAPSSLLANPFNFRVHTDEQIAAFSGIARKVGLCADVVVNRTTGHIVDGHLRTALAIRERQPLIPVTYIEVTTEEEKLLLATFDAIGAMAERDSDLLDSLLADIRASAISRELDSALNDLLAELASPAAAPAESDGERFKPETIRSGSVADLAPTEAERAVLAGRTLLIEYSGGKDSSAAAVWARYYFPENPSELLFVDMGADFVGFHLYLHDAAKFLGVPLVVLRSNKTVLDTMLTRGEWPHFLHPYCHENLHQPLHDYMRKHGPDAIAILRGGRQSERARTGKSNDNRFLVVDRMKGYIYFQPLYFSDKDTSKKLLDEAGIPVWKGYECGLQRPACRICPGQRPYSYSAIRAHYPEVWRELVDLERRFGPGAWHMVNPEGGHFGFEAAADKGQAKFEEGQYARPTGDWTIPGWPGAK